MIKYLFILVLILFCTACQQKADSLEKALHFAGNNRTELEKVLAHYSSDPRDSLKYRAAVFLIENMPYHYSLKENSSAPENYEKVYDAHIITADFLIRDIEQSFSVWYGQPWGSSVSFDDFCEEILPYRIKNELLQDWKKTYYSRFQPVIDSLYNGGKNAVEAVRILYDTLNSKRWIYTEKETMVEKTAGALALLENPRGSCYGLSDFAAYVMMALGIPGGRDFVLHSPYGIARHAWNYVRDSTRTIWEFTLTANKPKLPNKERINKGAVYRHCYALQKKSLPLTAMRKFIPPLLNNAFIRNVSEHYMKNDSICITPKGKKNTDNILYLYTFSKREWNPIVWAKFQDGRFTFRFLERGLLYLPAYCINGKMMPLGDPGFIGAEGRFKTISLDTLNRQSLTISRKYPPSGIWDKVYNKRILNGKFQAANDPQFKNPVTLHTVTEKSDMLWRSVDILSAGEYRCFRYFSGDSGRCNMAETEFLTKDGRKLSGRVIGLGTVIRNKKGYGAASLFDGDPLTFFDAEEYDGAWAGLELDKPASVRTIRYLFRNDDNGIRRGDEYELFYWNGVGWISLGRKTGESGKLRFEKAPKNAVFWLHNYSRGWEERPFVYHRGEQLFFSTDKIKQWEKE